MLLLSCFASVLFGLIDNAFGLVWFVCCNWFRFCLHHWWPECSNWWYCLRFCKIPNAFALAIPNFETFLKCLPPLSQHCWQQRLFEHAATLTQNGKSGALDIGYFFLFRLQGPLPSSGILLEEGCDTSTRARTRVLPNAFALMHARGLAL